MILLNSRILPSNSYDNVAYKVEKLATSELAEDTMVATVLAYVFDGEGRLALTLHPKRGWGLPVGHREGGESVQEAVVREVMEETRIEIVDTTPIGHIRMEMMGEMPAGYAYPYPTRIGQVFAARVGQVLPFTPIEDAHERAFVTMSDLAAMESTLQYEDELLWLPYAMKAVGVNV